MPSLALSSLLAKRVRIFMQRERGIARMDELGIRKNENALTLTLRGMV
jgi:hypothetical protein